MKRLFSALLIATSALAAHAATLQPAKSDVSFTFKQMGVPVDGTFKKFEAALDFDAKKPEAGKIAFTVDLGSVSLGDASFDAELAKAPWFDTKRNGKATFVSSAIKPTGPGKYDVAGKLTIKGASRDVTVPITVAGGIASGSVAIKRLDFKIGDGEWADTSMVANDVTVKFKLAFAGL
ncbi:MULTISPECIES: YceI family protein [unclassified Roseateles]|uniref:YceI family protein n=1 Tax=unclassified Roseateles TaxID=2626991 RepID=UPI0006FF56DB|nr:MULTISPECIES: YceI family protein [unclassified Roseateles]KQW46470.1 polyisoprenoid-binding protein [Pelomonas sp. Root405]KRA73520.1 polyisoprenoid-binding protein [Pelomonas sp. Root662]